jgi:[ribosomal protein S18]-alanine N-acetyltransferase
MSVEKIINANVSGSEVSKRPPVITRLSRIAVPDILKIEELSDSPVWNQKLFNDEFDNPHAYFFGARLDGKIVGYLLCHCIIDEAHILKFGILPDVRGNGVGRALISYVIRDLHANAAKWVTLEVRRSNNVALSLYESMGFSEVGVREKYYSDNLEDALVLSLNISQFVSEHGDHAELQNDVDQHQKNLHLFS